MRTTLSPMVLGAMAATVTLGAAPAFADKGDVVGTYDVKYEEVSNNCTQTGMTFTRGTLKIEQKAKTLTVNIDLVPIMLGAPPKAGKLKAQSKMGATAIQGLDGKYQIAGRIDDGVVQLVFFAEYYVKGKPLCTQSWNVTGLRQAAGSDHSSSSGNELRPL